MKSTRLTQLLFPLLIAPCTSGLIARGASPPRPVERCTPRVLARGEVPFVPVGPSALANSPNNDDGIKSSDGGASPPPVDWRAYRGPFIVSLLGLQAASNLFTRSLPSIAAGGPDADYFGAIADAVFLGWCSTNVLLQTGILDDGSTLEDDDSIALEGLECRVTVDVGREPGTWMPDDWAASGARLALPVDVRFAQEKMDLGMPDLAVGGRYCRRVEVLGAGSFVGPQGKVEVPVKGGGWSAVPVPGGQDDGARGVRFFLDFPHGASRNDVSIPAGRVYFSGAVRRRPGGLGGLELLQGRLTIKDGGGIRNLWGVLGEINLILGRYSVREGGQGSEPGV